MSNTPVQEPPAQAPSSGSGQTAPSRPFQPISDPSASKRVCFYKSGDYTFSGHRMVINARTFKTFDALLDALSKKVPLPFGVRTITTPRGTHLVKALDDLHDGGSYVCSDQRRVKPLNLEEVNRRQVPWNTTRPFSARRRKLQRLQFGRGNEVANRPRVTERVAIRTPKRLEVIKNRDPTIKRTIVLQRRTAPTFDALLDYLSQILQFPVLKLFSMDGRRVDGLAALILCSGVIVAAGNEPFRLGNYSFHRVGQTAQTMYMDTVEASTVQPKALNNKSFSSGRGSRNFSLSSERYIVNQIQKSRYGSTNSNLQRSNRSFETDPNHQPTSYDTSENERVNNDQHASIVPHDDDIEKSFRINQDGSMTVEMKVRLTIKEEEMLHWTTTLSRTSLNKRTACASISESGNSSTDSNNAIAKHSSSISGDELKEANHPTVGGKGVKFNDERVMGRSRSGFKRSPTPGAQQVKRASVESIKMVTGSGVQESTLGHYSYMERTADGETKEGYRVVRHSSSSSRPIPKPRKTSSAGANNKGSHSHSSIRSSGVAEVLQIQNNGMEVTETVMHIYESQGSYDNYFANEEYSADGVPTHSSSPAQEGKLSPDSAPTSSSNDCDIDFSGQQSTTDSQQQQNEEMLSLSSEPITQTHVITNHKPTVTKHDTNAKTRVKTPKHERKGINKPAKNLKSFTSTSSSDKKQKESSISPSKNGISSSTDKRSSNASVTKKSLSSSESVKSLRKNNEANRPQNKRANAQIPRREQVLQVNTMGVKRTQSLRQHLDKTAAKDNGHNVNTPTARPPMRKNMSDILQPKKALLPARKAINRPKSMSERKLSPPNKSSELSESLSAPSFKPSLSEIHQYVENWLEKVSPDPVPYTEESTTDESKTKNKVVFQIGADSESDDKTEGQTTQDELSCPLPGDVKKSASCLTVPLCTHADPTLLHNEHYTRGLCVSMPSVRVDPRQRENVMRPHKSEEAIAPAADNESLSSNFLSPKLKIKPVLKQIYSSIQCIRQASETNTTSNLEKTSSLPDFPTQVASVFGSSCKAFLSFLSVMTLRDNIKGPEPEVTDQSRTDSEAMLMMQSLQKISAIEDTEEQRASLTDLQSRASSQLRARWKDFITLRERLESEPLSPRVSETEFALDVNSEVGDVFDNQHLGIDELMEDMNMPADLRAEISSAMQQSRFFYPMEESTFVETEKHQSESEEEVEKFVEEGNEETERLPESDRATVMIESEQELPKVQKTDNNFRESDVSLTEAHDLVLESEKDKEPVDEGGDEEDDEEGEEAKENLDDNKEQEKEGAEDSSEEQEEESVVKLEEVTEDDLTEDEDGLLRLETEMIEVTEELKDNEDLSAEETDEREGEEETESEGTVQGKDDEGTEKGEKEDVEEENEGEEEVEESKVESEVEEETEEEREEEEKEGSLVDGESEEKENEEEEVVSQEEENGEGDVDTATQMEVKEDEVGEESEEEDKAGAEVDGESEERENEEEEDVSQEEENEEEDVDMVTQMEAKEDEVGEESEEEDKAGAEVDGESEEKENEEEEDVSQEEENEEEDVDMVTQMEAKEDEVGEESEEEDRAGAEVDGQTEEEENAEEEVDEMDEHKEQENIKKEEDALSEDGEEFAEENNKDKERKDINTVSDVEEEVENIIEVREEVEEVTEVVSEEIKEEEDEKGGEAVRSTEQEDTCDDDEDGCKSLGKNDDSFEHESAVEAEVLKATESEEDSDFEVVVENINSKTQNKIEQGEASYLQRQSSCEDDANVGTKAKEHNLESLSMYSSDVQCADDKGDGTDTANELEDEGEEHHDERCNSLPHPVEISQELLDFINTALQCASLIFTYDAHGKVRIEPDNSRVEKTSQSLDKKRKKDSSYGVKCLPSPLCSDLSDYRPETSESGGYQSQESVDIVTESGEEGSIRQFPVCKRKAKSPKSKLSVANNSKVLQNSQIKSGGSFSSFDSGTKVSKEDLSYFSASSSQKTATEAATEASQRISFPSEKDSKDGVLIDQGRWLLKENHLIRTSPPVAMGMYTNADTTSTDTSHSRSSADTPPHHKIQQNLLAALSSSELEEMAKPKTPKCTYYNMPHGSDSDPFMDDSSFKSGKGESSAKGRGVRVGPTINTSQTWANKNGSMSSFASVEFNIPDRRVHPEGEVSSMAMARRTSGGGGRAMQAQDSIETVHLRCSQYCPIL